MKEDNTMRNATIIGASFILSLFIINDSAQQLADAEVIRAQGVAKANQIIGNSLKDNREYLQYLYITGLEEGSNKGNVTIYVPTENGLPVPTLQMNK